MIKHIPTGIVHSGTKGGTTKCGVNTNAHKEHWVTTSEAVTCKSCQR